MQKPNKCIPFFDRISPAVLLTAAAAVVILAGVALLGTLTEISLFILCAAAFFLFVAAGILILILTDRHASRGADRQALSPVLGNIMLDTVMKQPGPVFIADKAEERIIWYNRAFADAAAAKAQMYGKTAEEFLGRTVASLFKENAADGSAVSVGERSFRAQAYNLRAKDKEFSLVSMTDVTESERLYKQLSDSECVVAYVIIDSLEELLQHEHEQSRTVALEIETVLREWAAEAGGILKEYERDRYLFLFEARYLDEFIVRKFDILDTIREIRVGEAKLPVTVSVGVAGIRGEFAEKERAAAAALDMALARGGDQVVVKTDNGIDFYGGRTKTIQKRTKVRARIVANELLMHMSRATNVLVMGHKYADFDAFGAMVGMARMAMFCGNRVNIVTDLRDPNLEGCRKMLADLPDYEDVLVDADEALEFLSAGTLLVIVDVNNPEKFESPTLAQNAENIIIIDHHRKTAEFEKDPLLSFIEPSASATCEIVAEMLEQVLPDNLLLPAEANLIMSGILLDTKQFTKNTGSRTFSAALYLRDRGALPAVTQSLFKTDLDDFIREAKFRSNVVIYRGITAIALGEGEGDAGDRIAAAKAADKLLGVNGVQASFALIRIGDVVHISARSTDSVNVQIILEALSGGGHFDAAAAQVPSTLHEALVKLKEAIDAYLDGGENEAAK